MFGHSVFCTARDEVKAVRLLDELKAAEFSGAKISVLIPERAVRGGFVPAATTAEREMTKVTRTNPNVLGGALESLLEVGMLVHPELGRFVGAGPLMRNITSALPGHGPQYPLEEFARAGTPPDQAQRYLDGLRSGKILLSIVCDSSEEALRSHRILLHAGAEDIVICAAGAVIGGDDTHYQQAA